MKLDKEQILEYQQNRPPYLMIDFAEEVVPGKSAKGYKDFKEDEWFFKVHWPRDPNVPGMLQIEALVQMSALSILSLPGNKGKVMYLTSANNIKFIKKIIPNKRLYIETKVKSFKRGLAICEGLGLIEKQIACKAEFNLILPEEIKKYNLKE
jgi:3-hydroxyacyl-[acyl-carrier-protein] dehydratase